MEFDAIESDEQLKVAMNNYLRIEKQLQSYIDEKKRLTKIIEQYLIKIDDPIILYQGKAWYWGVDGLGFDNYRELTDGSTPKERD